MDKPKAYNPKEVEKKWQQYWEKNKIYAFKQPTKKQLLYSIDTPPPTLSGAMHIGHAFSYSQGDFIARYQRMQGKAVLYPFGTDDNGLPTERMVEKLQHAKGHTMDRGAFIKLCSKTVAALKPDFVQPWKDIGISCDFSQSYSTIDEHCRKISQYSFLDLYHKGKIYREESPVAWCTTCQTAIAQAEFENREQASTFSDVVFKVHGKDVVISTTRPELLPACVAVMVHPSDEKHKDLIGKFATVPLFDFEVPICADENVDPSKGTGVVMCCTFGDKVDIEWWRKYKLPLRIVFEKHGKMNKLAGCYEGMQLLEARKQILVDLKKNNLLVNQKSIQHAVNVHDKCGTEIEFLKTKQWYIRVLDMKEELLEAADKITWIPAFMKQRFVHWVENLGWDWCISRQRFYGVPIPLWYCKQCGNILLADEQNLPVDPIIDTPKKKCPCGSKEFIPEYDVLDTWATSSLTPQIVLDWPRNKQFSSFYPMTLRLQAHEIIRTWAFYTVVKSLYHHKTIPWQDIVLSGLIMDPYGEKMSKSKGNILDPQHLLHKYSADPLRSWAASAKLGEDIAYQEKELVNGQKTVTKLWNASQFVALHLQDYKHKQPKTLAVMDQWLLTKLQTLVASCTDAFDQYAYWQAKSAVDNFFWHTFCDQYLEIIKDRLYNFDKRGEEARLSAQFTLHYSLFVLLKLFAPFMPFITEELYFYLYQQEDKKKSIHITSWPTAEKKLSFPDSLVVGDRFVEILSEVRQFKSKHKVSLKTPIVLTLEKKDYSLLQPVFADLEAACQAQAIKQGSFSVQLV